MNMKTRERQLATPVMIVVAAVLAAAGFGLLFGSSMEFTHRVGIALVGGIAAAAVALLHPNLIYWSYAFILGAAPFALVPGLEQPAVLVFAVLVWFAVLTHPIAETRTSTLEFAVGVLVITSFASVAMTTAGIQHIIEFAKWLLATSLVFALLRLDRNVLRKFGQVFAVGTFVGASFAVAMFFLDKAGTSLNYLSAFGYGRTGTIGTHLRFYVMENSAVVRLTGTYVDPNAAGIFLLVGFGLALALLRGWARLIMAPVILGALIITLSRSAIFSVVIAVLLYLMFQHMSTSRRLAIIGATLVGSAGALSVPAIYSRIFDSFTSEDTGTHDRVDALANFTRLISGDWWFGRGWGVPEFTDEVVGWKTNYVANSPLLTVYRGGIFTGIAFVAVLIAAMVLAYRNCRKGPWESGVIGAMFMGFTLVALQLDFPVVTHAPMTMAFSVLLVFVAANPIQPEGSVDPDDERIREVPNAPPRVRRKVTADV